MYLAFIILVFVFCIQHSLFQRVVFVLRGRDWEQRDMVISLKCNLHHIVLLPSKAQDPRPCPQGITWIEVNISVFHCLTPLDWLEICVLFIFPTFSILKQKMREKKTTKKIDRKTIAFIVTTLCYIKRVENDIYMFFDYNTPLVQRLSKIYVLVPLGGTLNRMPSSRCWSTPGTILPNLLIAFHLGNLSLMCRLHITRSPIWNYHGWTRQLYLEAKGLLDDDTSESVYHPSFL